MGQHLKLLTFCREGIGLCVIPKTNKDIGEMTEDKSTSSLLWVTRFVPNCDSCPSLETHFLELAAKKLYTSMPWSITKTQKNWCSKMSSYLAVLVLGQMSQLFQNQNASVSFLQSGQTSVLLCDEPERDTKNNLLGFWFQRFRAFCLRHFSPVAKMSLPSSEVNFSLLNCAKMI